MLEVLAILITIGSVLYHFSKGDFTIISIAGITIAVVFFLFTKSLKGFIFSLLILFSILLGAFNIYKSETEITKEFFGERHLEAELLSVDRRLVNTFFVIKDGEYNQNIRISSKEENDFLPGDRIDIKGVVEKPENFVTDNGRIFDYEEYLKNKNIVAVMENPKIKLLKEGNFSITRSTTILRYKIHDIFSRNISFPFDGILSAMVFGYQGGIPSWVSDLFRNTGVLHMLVLSGYNITLMVLFLSIMLRPIPFKLRTILTILFILALVLVSGGGVASIRAGIMGSIAAFAGVARRTYSPLRAMTVAYLFFFFITPNTIFSDPGFHLSFLATFFMVFVLPKTEKFFSFIPNYKYLNLREIISLAILMPVFTLPYIMYFSGIFPIVSPLTNAVLSIFVPTIMCMGILLMIVSWVHPIAWSVGMILSLFGNFVIFFLQKSSIVPIWNTPSIPWWCVSLVYILFIGFIFRKEIILYLMQIRNFLLQQTNSSVK